MSTPTVTEMSRANNIPPTQIVPVSLAVPAPTTNNDAMSVVQGEIVPIGGNPNGQNSGYLDGQNSGYPQQKRVRKKSIRRSGTIALNRMQSEVSTGSKTSDTSHQIHHHKTMDEIIANDLGKAKKSGIISSRTISGMAGFKKANLLDDPFSVIHQPLKIQSEFRFKIMMAFLGQMSVMYAVMLLCLFTPGINNMIVTQFASPVYRLSIMLATGMLLGMVFCVKYHPPISQIAMIAWTIFNGFVVACLSRHGESNAFHQIFGVTIAGVFLCALIAQTKRGTGTNRHLFSALSSGLISTAITVTISGILQSMNAFKGTWGHWFSANVMACMIVMWISYDTELLAHKMEPKEWNQCIVFFMTDLALLFLFCCLVCLCCCMGENACGDGGGGAEAAGGADAASGAGDVGNLA